MTNTKTISSSGRRKWVARVLILVSLTLSALALLHFQGFLREKRFIDTQRIGVEQRQLVKANSKSKAQDWLGIDEACFTDSAKTMLTCPHWQNRSSLAWDDFGVKVYVYENLPPEVGQNVITCRMQQFAKDPNPSLENFHGDLALIRLFETYPGRTYDPALADVFVVPYAHASHCMDKACTDHPEQYRGMGCHQVDDKNIDALFESLIFYNETTKHRHIFFLTADDALHHGRLTNQPLKLTQGGLLHKKFRSTGEIIVPYLNDHPMFQPAAMTIAKRKLNHTAHSTSRWKPSLERNYSFVYYYGRGNAKNSNSFRLSRRWFAKRMRERRREIGAELINEKPFIMKANKNGNVTNSAEDLYRLYQESIFCPCLPGDSPIQKRFYDAILNGCIPVMLTFGNSSTFNYYGGNNLTIPTWHPSMVDISLTLPLLLNGNETVTNPYHDYLDMVVQVSAERVKDGGIEQAMEELMSNSQMLQQKQALAWKLSEKFIYGMGSDAHLHKDAFYHIFEALRYHLDHF